MDRASSGVHAGIDGGGIPPAACPNCGYSRAGLAEETSPCPECGAPTTLSGVPRAWVVGVDHGLVMLAWGLGLGLLALTGAWGLGMTAPSAGGGNIQVPLPYNPFPLTLVPLLLLLAGTWVLGDWFSSGRIRSWTRRVIVGVVLLLGLALAARAVVGSKRDPLDLVQALGFRPNQVAELLFVLLLAALLVLSSMTRTVLAEACRAAGLFRIAGWVRVGRILAPIIVLVLLVGLRFEDRAEKAIMLTMSSGTPVRTLTEDGKFWLNFAGQGFKFTQMVLLATLLVVGTGTWLASVLARHRLRCLTAAP